MKPKKAAEEAKVEAGADLVDMEGAIALLKTTRPTFYRWLRTGKLKGMKVGRQWRFYRADVERFLKGEEPRIELGASLTPLMDALRQRMAEAGQPKADKGEATVEQAVALMIQAGIALKASDVHLGAQVKPGAERPVGMLRFRLDGVLHIGAEFDLALLRHLIERWKTIGAANVQENRLPQDCRIRMTLDGQPLDIRVCFMPAALGESMTARFLESKAPILSLDRMPFTPRDRRLLDKFLALPYGMLFVCGPVGSGKTTVLYSCLQQVARPETKVMSVEDPVEYILPWVTQIQVRPADGFTFAAALRSIMRSDPDVVLIGEIRDIETLKVAQQMALTGHLVMSTLHVNCAAGALIRLVEVGKDPFMVADSTRLIVGQRLVRRVCPDCARPKQPAPELLARARETVRVGGLDPDTLGQAWRQPVGCPACRQTGYRGRIIMAEAMEITPEIASAVRSRAPLSELQAIAVGQGMTTIGADGVRRAALGETTLEEVFRMLPPEA